MSGVDVLSVMDRAAAAMQFERDDHKYHRPDIAGWWDRLLIDTNEARAAVAELIEAAREFHEANENIGDRKAGNAHERLKRYGTSERRIRAALARVGGTP